MRTDKLTWHRYAPGKLNLFLHITGRRSDGYHQLQTLFQFIDWCDELWFTPRRDGSIHCAMGPDHLQLENNLILKAAKRLQQYSGCQHGANIYLRKKLFLGAGLGGGSSNAATTLVTLNQLWDLHLEQTTLKRLGLQLGADVPIFIFGRSAWAQSIGEDCHAYDPPQQYYLLVHPGCHTSTAAIFRQGIPAKNSPFQSPDDYNPAKASNDCEPVTCKLYPAVSKALANIRQLNPYARMTGTGSVIFAPYNTFDEAQKAQSQLPQSLTSVITQGINSNPLY